MKRILFSLLVLLGFISFHLACSNDVDINREKFDLNDTIEVSQNSLWVNDKYDVSIRIDSILSDSRCPMDAICIWAGNAEVRFAFSSSGQNALITLNTHGGVNFPSDTQVFGYNVELVELSPYPVSIHRITQKEYQAKVLLSRD